MKKQLPYFIFGYTNANNIRTYQVPIECILHSDEYILIPFNPNDLKIFSTKGPIFLKTIKGTYYGYVIWDRLYFFSEYQNITEFRFPEINQPPILGVIAYAIDGEIKFIKITIKRLRKKKNIYIGLSFFFFEHWVPSEKKEQYLKSKSTEGFENYFCTD